MRLRVPARAIAPMVSFRMSSADALPHVFAGTPDRWLNAIRTEAANAPSSGIVDVANAGRGRQGLIPLWVGEGDLPTPGFIIEAATRAMAAGETFYTWQRGIPELRAAIARYMTRHYDTPDEPERYFVTGSGMQAVQIAFRMVAGGGDEVIVPVPAWPNFVAAAAVGGATAVTVPMTFDVGGWRLDPERVAAAITPRTRALALNSPANPTGWSASREELSAFLALARKHGLWIVADEIYGRLTYTGARAASFHDVMDPDDRVLFVQTFSKNWAMTGWRLGWLEAPPALGQVIENLVQYSTSGAPVFVQRAGVVALDHGEGFFNHQLERCRRSLAVLTETLDQVGGLSYALPTGGLYLFFRIDGVVDSRAAAIRLIDEAGVGLAPGSAFDCAEEGFFRLCFARPPEQIAEAARRLGAWLGAQRR